MADMLAEAYLKKEIYDCLSSSSAILGILNDLVHRETAIKPTDEHKRSNPDVLRLFSVEANEDAMFPYAVHTIQNLVGSNIVVQPAVYLIDIWDANELENRVYELARAILKELHGSVFSDGCHVSFRLEFNASNKLPTGNRLVHRYQMLFSCRYIKQRELRDLLAQ